MKTCNDKKFYTKKNYFFKMFKLCREYWYRSSPRRKICYKNSMEKIEGLEKFSCKICNLKFAKSEVQCDHVEPIAIEPISLPELILALERLDSANLQILCKKCHSLKTKTEGNNRRQEEMIIFIIKSGFVEEFLLENLDYKTIKKIRDLVIKLQNDNYSKKHKNFIKQLHKITSNI